jgi:hypothetical protein
VTLTRKECSKEQSGERKAELDQALRTAISIAARCGIQQCELYFFIKIAD